MHRDIDHEVKSQILSYISDLPSCSILNSGVLLNAMMSHERNLLKSHSSPLPSEHHIVYQAHVQDKLIHTV